MFKYPHKKLIGNKKKKSSARWIERHINDYFVVLSRKDGYRSRASFKILEIDKKFNIFKKGIKVLDLGSSPGGWSQVAVDKVGKGNVTAIDILQMDEIDGVNFLQLDILSANIFEKINEEFETVMSDMAANTTGDKNTDHIRTMELAETAFNFATKTLKEGGTFITKIFQGRDEPPFFLKCKKHFTDVKRFKPSSSRKESIESYIIARGFIKNY
ncbi:MAG: RlmE family RNA methyltransferase [Rickettsiales bacterium]|jgi:23S rRNA (uridine2552-2'-O)-methyltransferase|nr:RlmE family RNA methyltransferase [Rickettsiales bacterium]